MKREKIGFLSIALACMMLFSSCGNLSPLASNMNTASARKGEFKSLEINAVKGSTTETAAAGEEKSGLRMMSSSGSSGYEYGQALWVVNCKESISLRTKPSTSADAILQIPLYAAVTYLSDADNGFLYVNYKGKTGYALSEYLDMFEPQIAIGEYMEVYKCKKSITLRKKPSTKAAEICQIPLGAVVYVIKDAANGFYMVEYKGLEGYALSSYLRTLRNSETDVEDADETDYYYGQPLWVVGVNESISLREKASTSSDAVLQIPLYAPVVYLADAPNGFLYVVYNDVAGYALSKYLDEFEPQIAIGEYRKVVNCKKSITLRKKPSTEAQEICQIPLGDIVYVIKDSANGFFMVEYNGKQGYALKKYLGPVT